ncbi:WD-40 repeat protein [Seminavis robusta]|uniref:WD-40 repeat protein n=1 Tax=Seminavis robusta TaxID=568900 RepID=A0A9N8HI47_9STRA|nr:WD-40 repeat protein [Seminavis robusta]|eukprot:Sro602_g173720.1 WD-40 repeat protein (531) ;mRNA; f:28531-30123
MSTPNQTDDVEYQYKLINRWIQMDIRRIDAKKRVNGDLKMARDKLGLVQLSVSSSAPMTSSANLRILRVVRDCAAKAWKAVRDPKDKITSLSILVITNYHLAAAVESTNHCNWKAGKQETFSLLSKHLSDLPELHKAAKEEMEPSFFNKFKDKEKQWRLLELYARLMSHVNALRPQSMSDDLPKFYNVESAVLKSCPQFRQKSLDLRFAHFEQPLLRGNLTGHDNKIQCCTVYQNGKRALTGSYDNTLKVWNLSTGKLLRTLAGHTEWVSCCAVLGGDSSKRALSGSHDRSLRVWDLVTGKQLKKFQGHNTGVLCCASFLNGKRAISGGSDNHLRLWNIATGKQLMVLEGHTGWIRCCAVTEDSKRALSGADDKTLRLWDLASGAQLRKLEGHNGPSWCCAFFEDGTRAISGHDFKAMMWDLETGLEQMTLTGQRNVECCALFPDGKRALTGSLDKTLIVWDLTEGADILTIDQHTEAVRCCAIFHDGNRFISGSDDKTLKMWDMPDRVLPNFWLDRMTSSFGSVGTNWD